MFTIELSNEYKIRFYDDLFLIFHVCKLKQNQQTVGHLFSGLFKSIFCSGLVRSNSFVKRQIGLNTILPLRRKDDDFLPFFSLGFYGPLLGICNPVCTFCLFIRILRPSHFILFIVSVTIPLGVLKG